MPFKMVNKNFLDLWVPVFAIIIAVTLAGCSGDRSGKEAPSQAQIQDRIRDVPADFNWKAYVSNYPDLGEAGIDTEAKAIEHWQNFGREEGRTYRALRASDPFADESLFPGYDWEMDDADSENLQATNDSLPSDFDWRTYVGNYKDLREAGIDTKEKAVEHWLKIGRKEGRTYKEIPMEVPDVPYMSWRNDSQRR
jgi:hypothetical protein